MKETKGWSGSHKTARNGWFDILRILCCICIIALHTSGYIYNGSNTWRAVQTIVRPALWTFMALTGYFAFRKPIENTLKFWYTHIIGFITTVTLYLMVCHIYSARTLAGFDPFVFIHKDPMGHLWYVYALIQIYILIPFLKKGLDSLEKKQLITLLITFFIIRRGIQILKTMGIEIGFSTDIVGNCNLYYVCLGYYLYKYPIKLQKIFLVPLVLILNAVITFFAFRNNVLVVGLCELSVSMVVGVICYITIFQNLSNRFQMNKFFNRIATFIGKRTFGIYIVHLLIMQTLTQRNILSLSLGNKYLILSALAAKTVLIFLIGFVISVVLDGTLVFITKWLLLKAYDTVEKLAHKIIHHVARHS